MSAPAMEPLVAGEPVRKYSCQMCGTRWESLVAEPPYGCLRCSRVQINWRNSVEVIEWLMKHDPAYRLSYPQGGSK